MNASRYAGVGVALVAGLMSVWAWGRVPDPMPVHWNAAGVADGYASRTIGLLLMPVVITLLTPLMGWFITRGIADPRGRRGIDCMMLAASAFLLVMHGLMIDAALSPDARLSMTALVVALGVLVAAVGVLLPALPQNRMAGIRTPWTLGDETNWKLTHRFGAWSFAIGGGVCVLSGVALSGEAMFWFGLAAIAIGATLPFAYSLMVHRTRNA